jgi:hypothetical protein
VLLLGLVSVWLIVEPDPALAPVMLPVIVPMVHANVLGALGVKAIFVAVPVQMDLVFGVVIPGSGFTVTIME